MSHKIQQISTILLVTLALVLINSAAFADYPKKPITLVTPYGAGGSSDLAARTLAASAPTFLGQPVIVVNKPGASGITGSAHVLKKKADGYTLLLGRIGCNGMAPALNQTLPFKWDSFTFLGMLELNPVVLVVQSESPYNTIQDLVDALKAKPGTLNYSHSGPQTVLAFSAQMMLENAGLSPETATGIPYKGGGGAKIALLGGHVDFLWINLGTVFDQIKAGKLRALAVTTEKRYQSIPDVPTVTELGYPNMTKAIGWSVLLGPPNLSEEVVKKWSEVLGKVSNDEKWSKQTITLGSVPFIKSPEETRDFIFDQYNTYKTLGEKLNLIQK